MKFVIPGIPETFEFLNSGKVTTGPLPGSSVGKPAVEVGVSCTSAQKIRREPRILSVSGGDKRVWGDTWSVTPVASLGGLFGCGVGSCSPQLSVGKYFLKRVTGNAALAPLSRWRQDSCPVGDAAPRPQGHAGRTSRSQAEGQSWLGTKGASRGLSCHLLTGTGLPAVLEPSMCDSTAWGQ